METGGAVTPTGLCATAEFDSLVPHKKGIIMEVKKETVKRQKVIEIEETTYICPKCSFSSPDERDIKKHYIYDHLYVLEDKSDTFVYFESESDYKVYGEEMEDLHNDEFVNNWRGAGWYKQRHYFQARSCGSIDCITFESMQQCVSDVENKIEGLNNKIRKFYREIAKLQEMEKLGESYYGKEK